MFLGALHAGIGCTTLNKVLTCVDISPIHSSAFKRYKREAGPAIEAIAKESCMRTAEEERRLIL